jgi:hypothetical protein
MRIRSVVVAGLVVWVSAFVAVAIATRELAGDREFPVRTLTSHVPAAGVTVVDLETGDAEVEVVAGPDDAIDVRVEASPASARRIGIGSPSGDPARADLETTVSNGVLKVRLLDHQMGAFEGRWTITAPARVAARLAIRDGRVDVTGLTGGVTASMGAGLHTNAGRIHVDVPRGALDLSIGVGDVDAKTGAAGYGKVDVRSTVGDASLYVDGHAVDAPHEPGPGHRLQLAPGGTAGDDLKVRATVGSASLRIR